jgi:hypothetical protein
VSTLINVLGLVIGGAAIAAAGYVALVMVFILFGVALF